MTDKKTFGSFIKIKRTEKNYSQKDLAEMLFVTEGAVSKWERGVSYPDITLISDLCRVLDISEHELITASTDTDARKMKHEARKFRVIRRTWFWVPTISYAVALLTCFICNLAVNHTLSWFFIVLTALICAYTFVPTVTCFFESKKLLSFSVSTYLSICLLLFACAVYTDGLSWLLTACIGVLIGYVLLFVPVLLSKSKLSRCKFVISFAASGILTILLLLNVYIRHPFSLIPAILITCYAFTPVILCAVICTLRFDSFLKAGICATFSTVMYYFTDLVVDVLFGTKENSYQVNFNDWNQCLEGNIHIIVLTSFLLISAIFIGIGIFRVCKNKKR
ncbi:MAG: helix-turn-helix transcriptional regulator [Ruminococcaceae bacterium]|nr:helix-turn-helix transcriptional regulator [Oscillospiraceae bacterium]